VAEAGLEAAWAFGEALGHSLGRKLHLLAPDNDRTCSGLAALSFKLEREPWAGIQHEHFTGPLGKG